MATYPLNRYVPGTYKRECDRCGFDFLRNQLHVQPGTELLVCSDCLDKVHPRDSNPPTPRKPLTPDR